MKAVIFDLDGVLLSTDMLHYAAWKQIADEEGIYFDQKINDRLRGVSRMDSLDIILENADRKYSDEEKIDLAEKKNRLYVDSLTAINPESLYPGTKDMLCKLKKACIRIAVGSSSKNARMILKNAGILDLFDFVSDGNGLCRSKPDPEVFLKAAAGLNADNAECIVVEDAEAGLIAAKRAGMTAYGIGVDNPSGVADKYFGKTTDILSAIIEDMILGGGNK